MCLAIRGTSVIGEDYDCCRRGEVRNNFAEHGVFESVVIGNGVTVSGYIGVSDIVEQFRLKELPVEVTQHISTVVIKTGVLRLRFPQHVTVHVCIELDLDTAHRDVAVGVLKRTQDAP